MAKYENPAELDYRNGGDTVDDFAQKYMRTVDYIIKALNDLRTPTGNTAGVEPEPYMWRIADNKLYIRNADNTDYVLLGDISPNFGFRQSVNDRFLTTADLEGDGAVVTRNEAGKVEGDITGSPGKIANKTIDVTPSADNDVIAYDATQQKWVKKTLNDYLKKQGDAGWDEMVDEVADQVIEDITPIIFNFWYLDDDGYLVPLVGSTEGGMPSIHGMVGDYEQVTARSVDVAGNVSATGNVTAGMVTTPQANVNTLTADDVTAGTVTANDIIAKGPIVDVRAFGAKGDGVHDDTAAFKSAISAAEGKTLLVPHGNYLLTEPVLALDCTTINRGDYADYHLVCKLPQAPVVLKSLDRVLQKKYYAPQGSTNSQGFCYNSKTGKFLMAEITSDNATTYIHVINPETWEIDNTYTYTEIPHCNVLAYNPRTNKIYVSSMNHDWGDVVTLNADTMAVESTVTVSAGMQPFAYDAEYRVFVVPKVSTALPAKLKLFIYDESFNLLKEVQTDITINTLFNGSCAKNGRLIFFTFDGFYEVDYSGNLLSQLQTYDKRYMIFEPEDITWAGDKLYFNANYWGVTGRRMVIYEYSFAEELYSDKDKLKTLPIIADTNLDNIVEEGTYSVWNNDNTVDLHYPKDMYGSNCINGVLKVEVVRSDFVKQIFWRCGEYTINSNHYEIYVRNYHAAHNTWSNWVEVSSRYAMKKGHIEGAVEVPANSYVDKVVTFDSPMPKAPDVFITMFSYSQNVANYALLTATYYGNSVNGFTIRIFNGANGSAAPGIQWLAVADW